MRWHEKFETYPVERRWPIKAGANADTVDSKERRASTFMVMGLFLKLLLFLFVEAKEIAILCVSLKILLCTSLVVVVVVVDVYDFETRLAMMV
jgi:hypothetical protein